MIRAIIFLLVGITVTSQAQILTDEYVVGEGLKITFEYDIEAPGVPHGRYTLFLNESIILEGELNQGKRHGKWLAYNAAGRLMVEGWYANNEPSGRWKHYRPSGNLLSEVSFEAGKRVGTWRSYHNNGEPWSVILFSVPDEPQEAAVYSAEGSLQYHEFWQPTDTGMVGERELHFLSGGEASKTELHNGVFDGVRTLRHPNGVVYERILYEAGKPMEVLEMRTDKGQPRQGGTLYEGTGKLKRYYPDGLLKSVLKYQNGLPVDTAIYYYRNGFKQRVEVYALSETRNESELAAYTDFNEGGKSKKMDECEQGNGRDH